MSLTSSQKEELHSLVWEQVGALPIPLLYELKKLINNEKYLAVYEKLNEIDTKKTSVKEPEFSKLIALCYPEVKSRKTYLINSPQPSTRIV